MLGCSPAIRSGTNADWVLGGKVNRKTVGDDRHVSSTVPSVNVESALDTVAVFSIVSAMSVPCASVRMSELLAKSYSPARECLMSGGGQQRNAYQLWCQRPHARRQRAEWWRTRSWAMAGAVTLVSSRPGGGGKCKTPISKLSCNGFSSTHAPHDAAAHPVLGATCHMHKCATGCMLSSYWGRDVQLRPSIRYVRNNWLLLDSHSSQQSAQRHTVHSF